LKTGVSKQLEWGLSNKKELFQSFPAALFSEISIIIHELNIWGQKSQFRAITERNWYLWSTSTQVAIQNMFHYTLEIKNKLELRQMSFLKIKFSLHLFICQVKLFNCTEGISIFSGFNNLTNVLFSHTIWHIVHNKCFSKQGRG
jgi:hypothetical protein